MHKQPPIEQTYLKVPCRSCAQVTPHVNHTDTMQCQVCFTSNFPLNAKVEHYDGWELAAFWQKAFYTFKRPFGIASNVGVVELGNDALNAAYGYSGSAPIRVTLTPPDKLPVTVNGTTHWLDKPAQKVQCPMPDAQYDIMLVEGMQGEVLASPVTAPLPHSVGMVHKAAPMYMPGGFATDFTALRDEIVRENLHFDDHDKVGYPDTSKVIDLDQQKTDVSDWDQRVQRFRNTFIDPNSIGTL